MASLIFVVRAFSACAHNTLAPKLKQMILRGYLEHLRLIFTVKNKDIRNII